MPLGYNEKMLQGYLHTTFFSSENKAILPYALVLFIIPLLPLTQLIVGTLVNAMLIKSAIGAKTNKILLLAIVPSIAAATGGVLFGGLTSAMLLMLPFIWAGNLILMLLMRRFFMKGKKNFFYSSLAGGTLKTVVLFAAATALFAYNIAPALMLTAFGILQFATAEAGAALVFGTQFAVKKIRAGK